MVRVTVWNEYRHELRDAHVQAVYPEGIHRAIQGALQPHFEVRTATLDEPEHGLTEAVLEHTDVLIWWGHMAHDAVEDHVVERVHRRILDGMGFIALHSAHYSKVFLKLMGTSCSLRWRDDGRHERLWVVNPGHAIVRGLPLWIDLAHEETYGEVFDIPTPHELVLVSWFPGGEVFRSGVTFYRGAGRIFYFRPGHEAYPTYYHPDIQKILVNAVAWAAPTNGPAPVFGWAPPLEGTPTT
ncbi:MAG: ThuA domain-containing protein [Firmicutes bacterium]|nr:ThuA domain-containing protein [Bacillota bacterium]